MEKRLSEPLRRPLPAMPALSGRPGSAWTVLLGQPQSLSPGDLLSSPTGTPLVVGGRRHVWQWLCGLVGSGHLPSWGLQATGQPRRAWPSGPSQAGPPVWILKSTGFPGWPTPGLSLLWGRVFPSLGRYFQIQRLWCGDGRGPVGPGCAFQRHQLQAVAGDENLGRPTPLTASFQRGIVPASVHTQLPQSPAAPFLFLLLVGSAPAREMRPDPCCPRLPLPYSLCAGDADTTCTCLSLTCPAPERWTLCAPASPRLALPRRGGYQACSWQLAACTRCSPSCSVTVLEPAGSTRPSGHPSPSLRACSHRPELPAG